MFPKLPTVESLRSPVAARSAPIAVPSGPPTKVPATPPPITPSVTANP